MSVAFVDLFCGMGGASCGARQAGMRVALAVDGWKEALETHARNHPDCVHLCAQLPLEGLPVGFPTGKVHVHASPPCQAFSTANKSTSSAKQQVGGDLVRWACQFARQHGTTWSLEQVPNPKVRAILDAEGVEYAILDLSYLGVPQTRRRLIAGTPFLVRGLKKAHDDAKRSSAPRRSLRDAIGEVCVGTHVRSGTVNGYVYVDGKRQLVRLQADHPRFARSVDEPSYTVTCQSNVRWWTPGETRTRLLDPPHVAALQTFPSDYQLPSKIRDARTQIGNALPPLLMTLIARLSQEYIMGGGEDTSPEIPSISLKTFSANSADTSPSPSRTASDSATDAVTDAAADAVAARAAASDSESLAEETTCSAKRSQLRMPSEPVTRRKSARHAPSDNL